MNKPVVLVVMDGIGLSNQEFGDAVKAAHTPTLDYVRSAYPNISIKAHGVAVGLPSDDDMGNSEVGHNAIGAGQIYAQGAKLVNASIQNGQIFLSATWRELINNTVTNKSTLHLIGLLSDGNVHSHIDQLKALIREAKVNGVRDVRVHALLDGRDVPATSALTYIDDMELFFAELNNDDFRAAFASGGGRMFITMDRYKADWDMVKRGWQTHVLAQGREFTSAREAILTYRAETPGVLDQNMNSFVIADENGPLGPIVDGDSVIFFNFRGDRAIELSQAFEDDDFPYFDRIRRPDVVYAGMLQYDGDLFIPHKYLVEPPQIENTLTEFLNSKNVREFAVSETQKYGHVTYFWNGNKTGKFDEDLEDYMEIQSDRVSFDERPWMKSAEITDAVIHAMSTQNYGFIRCNYPNGDMVGHTGVFEAVRISVEAVDLALTRLITAAKKYGYTIIATADHGNADDMYQKMKKNDTVPEAKTSHSLNPVPFIIIDDEIKPTFKEGDFGLANIAATITTLLGYEPLAIWEESMIEPQS